jgi:DNA-binding helix-hairpin-helix protein with protein kinase domain
VRLYLYLGVTLALAALLSFTHFSAFRAGKQNVKNEWAASVVAANAESRKLEQQRQRRAEEAQSLAAGRSRALDADARNARAVAGGLRDTLDATERAAKESHDTANNAVRALSELLGSCTAEYVAVAEAADRATSEVRTLRDAWPR